LIASWMSRMAATQSSSLILSSPFVVRDVLPDLVGIAGVGEVGVPVLLLREADADGGELREGDDRLRVGQPDAVRPVVLIDRRVIMAGPMCAVCLPDPDLDPQRAVAGGCGW